MRRRRRERIEYDEILLDATNLPAFNRGRMEGQIERPITVRSLMIVGALFTLIALAFVYRIFDLQVIHGAELRTQSDSNSINEGVVIAPRGVLYDRTGEMLAWNEFDYGDEYDFPVRAYTDRAGLGQLTGYVSYPKQDRHGIYFRTSYIGRTGAEAAFESVLGGTNGTELIEVSARGDVISSHEVSEPEDGSAVYLSVDAALSEAMYRIIETAVEEAGFRSGAAAIMDIETGAIIGMTSFPSYDPEVMADGDDAELIASYNEDERFPFLNKIIGGAYTPGSVVKPIVAYAALNEGVVTPDQRMVSTGELTLPNPYNPDDEAVFADWRDHGEMTLREAIAFSSNVYFFILGGGLPEIAVPQAGLNQSFDGLGITRIAEYMRLFGLGERTGTHLQGEQSGTVPDPAWKQDVFNDDWRLGDTYNTSIGQFGFQVTPIQLLRAYALIANGEALVTPHVLRDEMGDRREVDLNQQHLSVIREGMRMTVNYDGGTARSLERDDVAIAAKSGTAEIGVDNAYVNSWVAGYFPYEAPQYAFVLLMDRAPRDNALGATRVMGDIVGWMADNTPTYLGLPTATSTPSDGETEE